MRELYINFESPCINNCKLNEITNICEGCGRTIKEIMEWTFMTDEERKEIMKKEEEKGEKKKAYRRQSKM